MVGRTSLTVALCSMANFINAADRVIMPIAIIQMTKELKWNLHGQGWVLGAFALGHMSSQVIGGALAQRHGGKIMLTLAVFMFSLSTFLIPVVSHSIYACILLRIILGIGEGLGLPTIFHIFSRVVPMEERSRAFGYLIACAAIGQTFAAVVCPHMAWRAMFYTFGSLGLIWTLIWILIYKDIKTSPNDEEFADPPTKNQKSLRWQEFVLHWPLWAIYIAHFTMNWSNYVVMHWLPTYLTQSLGAAPHEIMYTAVPYIMNSLTAIAAGHFSDFLIANKWTVLSVRRLMTAIGLIGPGVFIIMFSSAGNLILAFFFISVSMALSACNSAGHLSNHADVAPNHAGITFAIANTFAAIPGIVCGPLTAELVVLSQGRWFPVFIIASLVNFVGAIVYLSQSAACKVL